MRFQQIRQKADPAEQMYSHGGKTSMHGAGPITFCISTDSLSESLVKS